MQTSNYCQWVGGVMVFAGVLACGSAGDTGGTSGAGLGDGTGGTGSSAGTSHTSSGDSSSAGGTQGSPMSTGGIDLSSATGSGGSSTTGEPPDVVTETPMACSPGADDSGCVGVSFEGESIPLDIYVMFDLSCSMSCSVEHSGCCRNSRNPDPLEDWRIQPVREAMKEFLRDPMSAGIGVGLGFFGDHDLDDNEDPDVCSVEAHTDAAVDIKALPGATEQLIEKLDAGEPQGGTPTHLAINGACSYVQGWKEQHPAHKVVVLLVTDGIPEYSCDADIHKARAAAEHCYQEGDGFQTYVLGVVANNNNSLEKLHEIAEAGGTEQAYLTDSDDVAGSVLEALNAIRADAVIPCDLQIPSPPDGETLDTSKVNLGVCDSAGEVVVTPYVESAQNCGDSPGWYYNDPNSPEAIHLCNVTCDTVNVPGSSLFFSVGCDTQRDDDIIK